MRRLRRPMLLVAVLAIALAGCSAEDPTNLVSPDSATEARGPAKESAHGPTTVDAPGLTMLAERSVDNCGIDATGLQPADYSRTYRCGLGRVVLYSVAGSSAVEAATAVDAAMLAHGCTSENPLISNPEALAAVESPDPEPQAIDTFYQCGAQDGAKALFGLSTDRVIAMHLPELPPSPVGTQVVDEPAIPAEALDEAAATGDRFVLVLHASIEYFKTSVCDGLHKCEFTNY